MNPPDKFFTAEQIQRLIELKSLWHTALNAGKKLPPSEQVELVALVEAELIGAGLRAEVIAKSRQRQN